MGYTRSTPRQNAHLLYELARQEQFTKAIDAGSIALNQIASHPLGKCHEPVKFRELAFAHPTRLKILEERGYLVARHYCLHCRHLFHSDIESKVLTPAVWESSIHMFDELGMVVYETIGRVAMGDGEQEAAPRDNGRVEAILDLRVIEEQLRQLTCSP